MKRFIRLTCFTGFLLSTIIAVHGQTRQVKLGDNLGAHMASKDLDMNIKQILNADGIAIGSATITNQNVALQIDGTNKAILMPRINALVAITSPVNGMLVYNSADNKFYVRENQQWQAFATVTDLNSKASNITVDNISIIKDNTGALAANMNSTIWNANRLQGNAVSVTAPLSGQVLSWNGTSWVPSNVTAATAGTVTTAAQPAITSVGTLTGLTVTNPIVGSITGSAATASTVTTNANLTGVVSSTGNATVIANGAITNSMLANTAVGNLSGTNTGDQDLSGLAQLASPALTGNPTAPNQTAGDNSTRIANTAYVDAAAAVGIIDATTLAKGKIKLAGDLSGNADLPIVTNAAVIGKALTGFTSGAGTVSSIDNILQAIQKVDGNDALKAPLVSPSFTTGITTPAITLGATLLTPTAAQLNFVTGVTSNIQTQLNAKGTGNGTVTTASVVSANGISGTVATASTTPAITLTLGAITPTSLVSSGTVLGTNLSGTNTGDQSAATVTSSATGNIAATTVQGAIAELETEKAPLASPTFTGTPTLPSGTIGATQTAGNSSTALATTEFVTTADNLKAPLASPTFTGTPTLPTGTIGTTQASGNSSTALATTEFVTTADNLKANLESPAFTGTPTAGTQAFGDNSEALASTSFVQKANPVRVLSLKSDARPVNGGLTEVTEMTTEVVEGTYTFQYFVIYQSDEVTGDLLFSVSHSGLTSALVSNLRYRDPAFTVDPRDPNKLVYIEGVIVVTKPGNLQLSNGSNREDSTVMAGTSLILTRTSVPQ